MLRRIALLAAVCVAVVAAAPPSAPVTASYVSSDSMEPTLQQNDGVLLVPAGDVETGDIVTFRSEQRGRLVTHRIVDREPEGFVTKGDANPSTDQASGYAHLQRPNIVGEVLTVGGTPVVLPYLGALVQLLQQYLEATIAVLLGLVGADVVGADGPDLDSERVLRTGDVLEITVFAAFAAVAVLALLGGVTATQSFVVTEEGVGADRTLTVDEPATRTVSLQHSPSPFAHTVVTTTGTTIAEQERTGGSLDVTVRVPPQPSTGVYHTRVRAYSYPAVLPKPTVRSLHAIHPVVAALVTAALAVAPAYPVGLLLVGRRPPVRGSRSRLYRRLTEN